MATVVRGVGVPTAEVVRSNPLSLSVFAFACAHHDNQHDSDSIREEATMFITYIYMKGNTGAPICLFDSADTGKGAPCALRCSLVGLDKKDDRRAGAPCAARPSAASHIQMTTSTLLCLVLKAALPMLAAPCPLRCPDASRASVRDILKHTRTVAGRRLVCVQLCQGERSNPLCRVTPL